MPVCKEYTEESIIINNKEVDVITIVQGSHEDAILTEI
jgi:hypothetical protein